MLSKKIQVTSTESKAKINLPVTFTRLWIGWISGTVKIYLNDDTAYDTLSEDGDAFELPQSIDAKRPHTDEVYAEGVGVINVEYESELI